MYFFSVLSCIVLPFLHFRCFALNCGKARTFQGFLGNLTGFLGFQESLMQTLLIFKLFV